MFPGRVSSSCKVVEMEMEMEMEMAMQTVAGQVEETPEPVDVLEYLPLDLADLPLVLAHLPLDLAHVYECDVAQVVQKVVQMTLGSGWLGSKQEMAWRDQEMLAHQTRLCC
jgi:hypothetical protein